MIGWLALAAWGADIDPYRPSAAIAQGTGSPQGEAMAPIGDRWGAGLYTAFAQQHRDATGRTIAHAPSHLYGSWSHDDKVRIDGFLPVYTLLQDSPTSTSGPALGDLRAQALVPLGATGEEVSFGLLSAVGLPTGSKVKRVGAGWQAGTVGVASGNHGSWGWLANLGVTLSPTSTTESRGTGSYLNTTDAVWFSPHEGMRVGLEGVTRWDLPKGKSGSNTSVVTHLFVQSQQPEGYALMVGAGRGWSDGLGEPDYRVMAALTYAPGPKDQDQDGLFDHQDLCPLQAEDLDGFEDADGCPDPDNDGDTVLDAQDLCALVAEDLDQFEDLDGCPAPDNDNDGVLDGEDDCPVEAGTTNGCPDRDQDGTLDEEDLCPDVFGLPRAFGCPDQDHDGVPDQEDLCPDQPAPIDEVGEERDGCPRSVFLTEDAIVLTEHIPFELGSASLLEPSYALLDRIVAILLAHPQITSLEVAGHTDSIGSDPDNQNLSRERAQAVVQYLTVQGVARERLIPQGYGEDSPSNTNRTERGRIENRRVEFLILQQSSTQKSTRPGAVWPQARPGADPAGEPGKLTVRVAGGYWADVYLNGVRLNKGAPFVDLVISAGAHELRAVNPRQFINWHKIVVVENGQSVELRVPVDPR